MPRQAAPRTEQALTAQQRRIRTPPNQIAPDRAQRVPRAIRGHPDRAVGGDRAPRDPTATVEEAVDVAGHLDHIGPGRQRDHLRTSLKQRGPIGVETAVHPDRRAVLNHRHRPREQIGGRIGRQGEVVLHQISHQRLIEHHQLRGVRKRLLERRAERISVRAHRLGGHPEREIDRSAGSGERQTEGHRSHQLPLHRAGIDPLSRRDIEKRPKPGEIVRAQIGDHRSLRVEGGDIDGDRAVLTEGHSPRPDDGLRDELLGRGSPREARDHRDVEVVEGESSRRLTIAVRKAADTERRTGPNTAEHPARLGLRGVDRRHRQIVP